MISGQESPNDADNRPIPLCTSSRILGDGFKSRLSRRVSPCANCNGLASSNRHHSLSTVIVLKGNLSRPTATPATHVDRAVPLGAALQCWAGFPRIVATCCRPDTSRCDQSHVRKIRWVQLALTIGAMAWCRDGSERVWRWIMNCDRVICHSRLWPPGVSSIVAIRESPCLL